MTPAWMDWGGGLVKIIASSVAVSASARFAFVNVAQTLLDMTRLGFAQDLREHREHLREKNRLERENLAADVLVKRATAAKTVAEAVQLANASSAGAATHAPPGNMVEWAAELHAALGALGSFGGELGVDSTNLEALSKAPVADTRVATIDVSPASLTLTMGIVSGSLETVERQDNLPNAAEAREGAD